MHYNKRALLRCILLYRGPDRAKNTLGVVGYPASPSLNTVFNVFIVFYCFWCGADVVVFVTIYNFIPKRQQYLEVRSITFYV